MDSEESNIYTEDLVTENRAGKGKQTKKRNYFLHDYRLHLLKEHEYYLYDQLIFPLVCLIEDPITVQPNEYIVCLLVTIQRIPFIYTLPYPVTPLLR